MSERNFIDYVKIWCESGNGGAGSAHFLREKKNPRGGPDGGDGGRGGHLILKANAQLWTLLSLKYRKHIKAEHGVSGSGNNSSGAFGDDVVIEVPCGTVVKDPDTGEILMEVTEHDETKILMKGGRGGLGNSHFKSATYQAPKFAQPGEPGEEGYRILELKILADVGLVGFPNAGKSTLLASITAAKPEIANYPFTTLTPNLGIVSYRDAKSFIMADIPGIIENAHAGKGLGLQFLKHIERNSVLLFIISVEAEDINKEYRVLLRELELFNPELTDKPRLVGISKADLVDDEMMELLSREFDFGGINHVFFSAVSGKGLTELKDALWKMLNS